MTAEGNAASELREAMAEALFPLMHADDRTEARDPALAARLAGQYARDAAGRILALPELAALRAKAAAADRVRAIAYEDTWGEVDPLDHRDRILAALDGPAPC